MRRRSETRFYTDVTDEVFEKMQVKYTRDYTAPMGFTDISVDGINRALIQCSDLEEEGFLLAPFGIRLDDDKNDDTTTTKKSFERSPNSKLKFDVEAKTEQQIAFWKKFDRQINYLGADNIEDFFVTCKGKKGTKTRDEWFNWVDEKRVIPTSEYGGRRDIVVDRRHDETSKYRTCMLQFKVAPMPEDKNLSTETDADGDERVYVTFEHMDYRTKQKTTLKKTVDEWHKSYARSTQRPPLVQLVRQHRDEDGNVHYKVDPEPLPVAEGWKRLCRRNIRVIPIVDPSSVNFSPCYGPTVIVVKVMLLDEEECPGGFDDPNPTALTCSSKRSLESANGDDTAKRVKQE